MMEIGMLIDIVITFTNSFYFDDENKTVKQATQKDFDKF